MKFTLLTLMMYSLCWPAIASEETELSCNSTTVYNDLGSGLDELLWSKGFRNFKGAMGYINVLSITKIEKDIFATTIRGLEKAGRECMYTATILPNVSSVEDVTLVESNCSEGKASFRAKIQQKIRACK